MNILPFLNGKLSHRKSRIKFRFDLHCFQMFSSNLQRPKRFWIEPTDLWCFVTLRIVLVMHLHDEQYIREPKNHKFSFLAFSFDREKKIRTCRTRRNLRFILHGCAFTDCNTSLCNRMFSKICSFVDFGWFALSPSDIAVLDGKWKKKNTIFTFHFIPLRYEHHPLN